jgi:hypothetical protein
MSKRKYGTGAGALIGLASTAFAQNAPHWGADHPHLLILLYAATFAVVIIYALQFEIVHNFVFGAQVVEEPQPPPFLPEKQYAVAGRDASQTAFGSGNVLGDSAIKRLFPSVKPEAKTEETPASDVRIPRLLIGSPQRITLSNQSQQFSRSEQGLAGMIVRVENPEALVGHQGIKASGVLAKIRFSRGDGELLGTSEYAHWLDILENRTNIAPGESRALVIGLYSKPGAWLYYSNKIDKPILPGRSLSQWQAYANRLNRPLEYHKILFNPTIDAHVTLMSKYDGYTLAQKSFRLSTFRTTMGEIDFMCKELS